MHSFITSAPSASSLTRKKIKTITVIVDLSPFFCTLEHYLHLDGVYDHEATPQRLCRLILEGRSEGIEIYECVVKVCLGNHTFHEARDCVYDFLYDYCPDIVPEEPQLSDITQNLMKLMMDILELGLDMSKVLNISLVKIMLRGQRVHAAFDVETP